jgi:hypothetical protein
MTTAVEMARQADVDPKRFRAALRKAGLRWHSHNGRWEVVIDSSEHRDMVSVLALLGPGPPTIRPAAVRRPVKAGPSPGRDEAYVIDLCDAVLGQNALRQHRFPFLVGDPDANGRRAPLPVDAFYPALKLVVEYHERQHTERVGFFDNKATVSGVGRGEQRRRYDDYRRTLLPKHGYELVCLDYSHFAHDAAKRLRRGPTDRAVIERTLLPYLHSKLA